MLKPPHSRYSRIFTYHLEGTVSSPFADDPDFIGSWEEDGKTILVFHAAKDHEVEKLCKGKQCRLFYQADLDYADWEMGREIVPFTVGPLTVAPVWESQKADIHIDPSVVFGNGFHPSTRLCLHALVTYYDRLPRGFTVLDLGCGTGLLGIAAARLGAGSVVAVDHNSLACAVTQQNAVYNGVENIVKVQQMDLNKGVPAGRVDVIMANLHPELLAGLFQGPTFWRAGLYILSGFMPGSEEQLLLALPASPPLFLERGSLDKWRVWVLGNP